MAIAHVVRKVSTCAIVLSMETTSADVRLAVSDLEFVPERTYAAFHGCEQVIIARGTTMREALDAHTSVCTWSEPTA